MQRLVVAAGCGLPAAIPFTSENVFDVCAEIPEVTRPNRQLGNNQLECMEIVDAGKLNINSWRLIC